MTRLATVALALLACAAIAAPHHMLVVARKNAVAAPIALLVSTITRDPAGPLSAITAPIDTTGADLLVVAVSSYTAQAAPTTSDSQTNTWQALTAYDNTASSGIVRVQFFYDATPSTSTSHTFSATHANNAYPTIAVMAFSNTGATPFDTESGAGNNGPLTIQPGSVTPAAGNSVLLSAISNNGNGGTFSISGGLAELHDLGAVSGQGVALAVAYEIQTTATARNPTWTASHNTGGLVANIAVFSQ